MPPMCTESAREVQAKSRMREIHTYGSVRDRYPCPSSFDFAALRRSEERNNSENKQNQMEVL